MSNIVLSKGERGTAWISDEPCPPSCFNDTYSIPRKPTNNKVTTNQENRPNLNRTLKVARPNSQLYCRIISINT